MSDAVFGWCRQKEYFWDEKWVPNPYRLSGFFINALVKVMVWAVDVTWVWAFKYYKVRLYEKIKSQVLAKRLKRWFAGFVDDNRGRHFNRKRT